MSRSLWKGPFSDLKIIKPLIDNDSHSNTTASCGHVDLATLAITNKKRANAHNVTLTVWSRRSQILPAQADKKFLVHNGRTFINVKCTESMCSRKFGEFAVTRKKPSHKLNKRKQLHKNIRR